MKPYPKHKRCDKPAKWYVPYSGFRVCKECYHTANEKSVYEAGPYGRCDRVVFLEPTERVAQW